MSFNLTPNHNLPPLERELQGRLLKVIDEFSWIAYDLGLLGKLDEFTDVWSSALECAFTEAINDSPGQWE